MKHWFALSAIGPDRPGIVADLAELIFECDCNLEDSSMTILGNEFAVLLLLTGEGPEIERRLSSACKRLEWEKRITVFFRPLDREPLSYAAAEHARPYQVQAVGVDKAGLVAKVARCLADHRASITHMSTQSRPEPLSGTPMYNMNIRLAVPETADLAVLQSDLDAVAASLHIELTLSEAE